MDASGIWIGFRTFIKDGSNTLVILFMLCFIISLMWVFIKGTLSINIKSLFIDEHTNKTSHVKYWANVAYLSATISFLSINLFFFKESSQYIEILWLIYLGVVASNATVSKLISYKYNGAVQQQQSSEYQYPPRRYQSTIKNPTRSQNEIDSPD
jgi:uncharacterized membrane protein (Fun14 family)